MMALYEALRSFGGKVSASKGRTVEITNKKVAEDLLEAGYIKAVGGKAPAAEKPAKPAPKPAEAPVEEPAVETPAETPEAPEQPTEEKEAPAAPEATK